MERQSSNFLNPLFVRTDRADTHRSGNSKHPGRGAQVRLRVRAPIEPGGSRPWHAALVPSFADTPDEERGGVEECSARVCRSTARTNSEAAEGTQNVICVEIIYLLLRVHGDEGHR